MYSLHLAFHDRSFYLSLRSRRTLNTNTTLVAIMLPVPVYSMSFDTLPWFPLSSEHVAPGANFSFTWAVCI
jgi:hypothetical protein